MVRSSLQTFGINPDRVWFRFISASEGKKFAETVTEMVEAIKEMGPNPASRLWEN